MSVLLCDDVPLLPGSVMPPDELYAYREGERACLSGTGFFGMPYRYEPRGDNSLLWCWIDGYFDAERRAVAREERAVA